MPTSYHKRQTPITKRMAEDMLVRNLAPRTIDSYTYHVDRFARHFGKLPEDLGPEQIREFQLWLIQVNQASWSQFNQAVCSLRFLYTVTLPRPWSVAMIPFGKRPKKLPTVLGQEEVHDLIQCVTHPKHRAVLLTLYAAGLRLAEATHLKLPDIDSQRMQLKVNGGKGGKDRYVPISPRLLEELRTYWKIARPSSYLFPGKTPDTPLSGATIQKACKLAAAQARITKTVTPHTLRHSFATPTHLRCVPVGSGCRLDGYQQAAGAQQFCHDDDLFALPPSTLQCVPQSDRLAAGASMSTVGRPVAASSETDAARGKPGQQQPALTVASILKQYTEPFIKRYHDHLSCHVESTLGRIGFCRTAPMKGRKYRCPNCDSTVLVYNSCTDRHCPQCMGARRADWVDNTAQLLRGGTEYFQVVFTIPDKLSSLVLGNRRPLYRLLFRSAARALQRSIGEECGIQAASTMVLHTWNQRLGHHPHVHVLVPGSGPSLDGTRWIPCRYTQATRKKPARPFLVDNTELGRRFRDSYVCGVRRLIKAGLLKIDDLAKINTILDEVQACDWVVYIQPPPTDTSDPEDVLKYLARYMTGGPISDRRLIEVKDGRVYFWARSSDKSGRQVPVSLPTLEFVRCWTLHILPKGFTKARCRPTFGRCPRLEQHAATSLPAAVRGIATAPVASGGRPA